MNSKEIAKIAEDYFKVNFRLKSRERRIIYIRAIVNELCKQYTKESLKKIGSYYKADHATVLHSLRKFKYDYLLQTEPFNVANEYEALDKLINIKSNIKNNNKQKEIINCIIKEKNETWLSARCIELSREIKHLKEVNKQLSNVNYIKLEKRFIPIISDLKDMSDIQLSEFHETRLKPFKKALESRVQPKVITKISGALLNVR